MFVQFSRGFYTIASTILSHEQSVVVFCVYSTQADVVSSSRYFVEVKLNGTRSSWSVVPKGSSNFHFFFVEDGYVIQRQYVEGVVRNTRVCITVVGVLAVHVGSQSSTVVF